MLHQNVDLYICEHCRLEFYDEEECLEHEKTHSPHFDGSTNEDIAKELDALGANDHSLIQKPYERGSKGVAERSRQCRKKVSSTRHSASCTT